MTTTAAKGAGGGLLYVVIAASLWGTVGPVLQVLYGVGQTTPLTMGFLRLGVAAPILLLACWRLLGRAMFRIERRDLLVMVGIGAMMAQSQASYYTAISNAGVAVATLVTICSAPVLVALATVLFYREPLTGRIIFALVAATVGTLLLVYQESGVQAAPNLIVGVFFALFSALGFAGVLLAGRFIAGRYHPVQVTAVSFSTGALLLLVVSLTAGFSAVFPPEFWLLVLYLGVVPTSLAYGLFLVGMRSTPAAVASIVSLLEPLVATALSWAFFGEYFGPLRITGAVLLCGAIVFLSREDGRRAAAVAE